MKYEERCEIDENQEFSYILIRKNVKNINLNVKANGNIVVSAHPRVPREYVDDFVRSKIPFIQKARDQMRQKSEGTQIQQFITGEKVPYLGRFLTLQVQTADTHLIPEWIANFQEGIISSFCRNNQGEAVFCKDESLYLYTFHVEDIAYKQQLYETWQKIQASILCKKISREYYPVFQKAGIVFPEIKIRKMSSRWGSCIPAKHKVTFNSLLIEKPYESIEYVVVHEFSHFKHPNHSKAFYDYVEEILPDWRSRKAGLG